MTEKQSTSALPLMVCLLGLSTLTNFMLVTRVHRLQRSISFAQHKATLSEGDQVPSETLADVRGKTWSLSYTTLSSPTILYIMTPECGWCRKNSDVVSSFAKLVDGRYRFLAVSLTSAVPELKDYMDAHHVEYPVYLASARFSSDYKAVTTPTTIVVGTDGKVLKVWRGAYFGDVAVDIERYFHVQLPHPVNKAAQ